MRISTSCLYTYSTLSFFSAPASADLNQPEKKWAGEGDKVAVPVGFLQDFARAFFFFFRGHAFCMEKSWAELAGWISLASAISPGFLDDFLAQRLICFGSSSGEQSAWGSPIWTTPMSRWQFESGPWTGEVRLWFQYVCTFIHMNKHTSYICFI